MNIQGQPGFIRDASSGAVINNNREEYIKYKKRQDALREKDKEINSLKQKLENLEKLFNEHLKQNES